MRRALDELVITGIKTNTAFHQRVFEHPDFIGGRISTSFLEAFRSKSHGV